MWVRYFAPLFLKVDNMTFGFIISRHVNSDLTNKYWNTCVQQLNLIYPNISIIIIDDNSNPLFLKSEHEYNNLTIVQSEYPKCGELLPYYYFYKNHYFDNAVIIHDSIFFKSIINFNFLEKQQIKVIPLWHFNWAKQENSYNTHRLASILTNNSTIINSIGDNQITLSLNNNNNWSGCFGVQAFINHSFLCLLQNKYKLFNLLKVVKCRADRCCLERLFAIIFYIEYPILYNLKSLLGAINKYCKWGLTYNDYIQNNINKKLPIIKVWTGR